jgi:hypothetical protein
MKTFKEWLLESTIKDMVDGTKEFQNTTNAKVDRLQAQAKQVEIQSITLAQGVKTITFSCQVPSFTKSSKYTVQVVFTGIEFGDRKMSPAWRDYEGIFFKKPNVVDNRVILRCSCPDARHRFGHAWKVNKSLFRAYPKYVKKTNRPYLNPDNIEGLCKHLHSTLIALENHNWIDNVSIKI